MASRAAKKRAKLASRAINAANQNKGGRPRSIGVPRRKDGSVDNYAIMVMERERTVSPEEARINRRQVVEARCRRHGIREDAALRTEWGYSLGRLYMSGALGPIDDGDNPKATYLLDAGNRMHDDFVNYYALTGISMPTPRAMDMLRVRGHPGPDRSDQARKASSRVQGIMGALGLVDEQGRPVTVLVRRLVIEDEEWSMWTPQMVAKVKRGLAQLVDFYGIGEVDGKAGLS